MSPSASLNVKVTVLDAEPDAPLMLQVTVVPSFTIMFSGQVTVAFGMPCAASDFSTAASAVEPGTWTEPGVSSYVYLLAPCCVTVAFPVAPLSKVTVQVNVSPFCTGTSLGHFALVTFADEVDRSSVMPCSTCASSTVFGVALVAVPSLELPQPPERAPAAMAVAPSSVQRWCRCASSHDDSRPGARRTHRPNGMKSVRPAR